ncbi:MAG: mannose-6-phosphate isomerase [Anaerolineae bacterium]|nr:mannose-6-phosphate isomerase [Anaerolineae bacterium]
MPTEEKVELYPLKFKSLPKEKVWGGSRIAARFDRGVPAGRPIGEAWLVWDQLAVSNGPFQGRTLAELVRSYPVSLLGSQAHPGQDHAFPLLIKILDANDTLSVQVHPDDLYAQEHEGEPFGKAEVWMVLDAEPEACLIHGVKRPLTRTAARRAIEHGTLEDELEYVKVSPGDVIMVAPGTIHALGGGILLYELQQSSDLTYRLYDWDRRDPNRPLHIEKSLEVARLDPFSTHKITPVEIQEAGGTRFVLCACQRFAAELLRVRSAIAERPEGECFHVLTALGGEGQVRYGAREPMEVRLEPGESVLVPAGLEEYEIQAGPGAEPFEVVKAFVPHRLEELAGSLRQRGISDEAIHQLRGEPG